MSKLFKIQSENSELDTEFSFLTGYSLLEIVGQFDLESGGKFNLESDGQFHWNYQS